VPPCKCDSAIVVYLCKLRLFHTSALQEGMKYKNAYVMITNPARLTTKLFTCPRAFHIAFKRDIQL
jgi:peptide subunit release factor 1 (eRF1)